ncbi:MAG: Gfo/Idh/MocA family oxidoreductase [Gemmataceae bacterium]
MSARLDRRHFLSATSAMLLPTLAYTRAADSPGEKVVMAVLGVRGRGQGLIRGFAGFDDVEIAYLCDPDLNVIPDARKCLPASHKREPKVVQDMRRAFDDPAVNAVAIAAPDHWHALATIWALQAGKHVYVEKPVSHNLIEGRRMVQAARKYNKVVQVGTQRRSAEFIKEAAAFVRSGKLGKIPFARTWIAGDRKTIGKKPDGKAPDQVDYNLWLGPAPLHAFNPNRFHYNWHWFWDYGTGELGNNGIHGLDVARLLLGLDAPVRITSGGGKYFYDDDQQTPDTQIATFDFPTCSLVWEHRIWAKTGVRDKGFGIELVGQNGTLVIDDKGWHVHNGIEAGGKPTGYERPHLRNFIDCIKSGKRPNADIEIGHHSTRLCHLGNIAYRLGRTLKFDPTTETIPGDADANALLGRTYRKGFELPAL